MTALQKCLAQIQRADDRLGSILAGKIRAPGAAEFRARTDVLAESVNQGVSFLPAVLGISRATFFAYRQGSRPITEKSWAKLRRAEKGASENIAAANPNFRRLLAKLLHQSGIENTDSNIVIERGSAAIRKIAVRRFSASRPQR